MVIVVIARELFACKLLHITRLDEIRCVRKYYPLESAKSNDIQQISLNEAKQERAGLHHEVQRSTGGSCPPP